MANWCNNEVFFSGPEKNLEQLERFVNKTIEMQELSGGDGQILFGLEGVLESYLFEISYDDNTLFFLTKWNSAPQEMVRIAQAFNLTFNYEYDEPGCAMYGRYTYDSNGYLYLQYLTDEDVDSCRIKDNPDDFDELGDINYELIWDLLNNAERVSVDIHSSLNQPK